MTHRTMPSLVKVMTPFPYTIGPHEDVSHAWMLMQEHGIRHLAVQEGHDVVGVISERDLRAMHILSDVEKITKVAVDQLASKPAYVVDRETPLDVVVATLAEKRLGCALVTDKGKLVGILTTTDVCELYAKALRGGDRSDVEDEPA